MQLSDGSDMSRGSISLAALLWLVIAFLVLYPLSILVVESFKIAETGGWGIGNYLEFFKDAYYLKTFKNTLLLSTMVLLTTTVFGVPLAYILARYRHRGKTIFTALILLPIVLPAFAGVFAFFMSVTSSKKCQHAKRRDAGVGINAGILSVNLVFIELDPTRSEFARIPKTIRSLLSGQPLIRK